jgi:transposase
MDAIEDAARRLRRVDEQLASIVPSWSMAPVVEAYQAMRGASFVVAVTFAAEIGDVRRFETPRQLMAFLGLVPGERSTGKTVRRTGLTLAGNRRARRVLIEAAWAYRYPARVSETLRARLENQPKAVREIAWKPHRPSQIHPRRPFPASRPRAALGSSAAALAARPLTIRLR